MTSDVSGGPCGWLPVRVVGIGIAMASMVIPWWMIPDIRSPDSPSAAREVAFNNGRGYVGNADAGSGCSISHLGQQELGLIFSMAGGWSIKPNRCFSSAALASAPPPTARRMVSCWDVCRHWRDCMQKCPVALAGALLRSHGPEQALLRAVHCRSSAIDRRALVHHAIKAVAAETAAGTFALGYDEEGPLMMAAFEGNVEVVRLLLEEGGQRADSRDGAALVISAACGHEEVARLLMEWPEHGPRPDCMGGVALVWAAAAGAAGLVQLLLEAERRMESSGSPGCYQADIALIAAAASGCRNEGIGTAKLPGDGDPRLTVRWTGRAPPLSRPWAVTEGCCSAAPAASQGKSDYLAVAQLLLSFLCSKDVMCVSYEAVLNAAASGNEPMLRLLLGWGEERLRADCWDGLALVLSAANGRLGVLTTLLEWEGRDAPRADCQDGQALVAAAKAGHTEVIKLLLGWRRHAPRADCQDGQALVDAASEGRVAVVRLLLEWPKHPPRADCQHGQALVEAAFNGHLDVVWLLLEWGQHAPRADCQRGRALVMAARRGHEMVVRTLLSWREHAPRADCLDGNALVMAASWGHGAVVLTLLGWRENPPDPACQGGRALEGAVTGGHKAVAGYLRGWNQPGFVRPYSTYFPGPRVTSPRLLQ